MRIFSIILGTAIALSGCSDADEQNIKPGTFYLEVFNENGVKLMHREGEAIGLGSDGQLVLQDETFIDVEPSDPENTFAYLFITNIHDKVWDDQEHWSFESDLTAVFHEQYYTWINDWAYEATGGEVEIQESTGKALKGSFTISMQVKQEDTGELWQQNEAWGEKIVVKGIFNSRGW